MSIFTQLMKYAMPTTATTKKQVPIPQINTNDNIHDDSIYAGTGLGVAAGAGLGGMIGGYMGYPGDSTKNTVLGGLIGGGLGGIGSYLLQKRSLSAEAPSLIQKSIENSISGPSSNAKAQKVTKSVSTANTPIKFPTMSTKEAILPSVVRTKSTTPGGGSSLISAGVV